MTRVACIGDSITWGFTLLARRLRGYFSAEGIECGRTVSAIRLV